MSSLFNEFQPRLIQMVPAQGGRDFIFEKRADVGTLGVRFIDDEQRATL
jgi:hypothetical protein